MTTAIGLRFPLGRYHATRWGRAVNEAVVDWPPSPWRLLRAFYATWRWRAPAWDERTIVEALQALSAPPSYLVPRYSFGHSRHWMPDATTGKDKALDAFVVVDPDAELTVRWPAELPEPAAGVIGELCRLLPHLGRAESLCSARLLSPADTPSDGGWIQPGALQSGHTSSPLLAPTDPLDIDALLTTTSEVRKAGRTVPPGSRWVSYPVPAADQRPPTTRSASRSRRKPPQGVRLALAAPVLPSVQQAVVYGHVLRAAALSHRRQQSETLSGRQAAGGPDDWRTAGHVHAHYLVYDSDDDRLLDTAVVWAPEGLCDDDLAAILSIDHLHSGAVRGFRPVRTAPEAIGPVERVAPELCSPSGATVWRSATPFAPYRHPKERRPLVPFLQGEIVRELAAREQTRNLGEPEVSLLGGAWLSFRRARPPGREDERRAFGLCLTFANPVQGPLVLGDLSHFGLGLFRPDSTNHVGY